MSDLLTQTQLSEMLEGNRRLTVRTLTAFPEEHLFSYAAPGMRCAADLFKEAMEIERAYVRGIATGEWVYSSTTKEVATKQGLLEAFEALRRQSLEWWQMITADRLTTVEDDGFGFGGPTANLDRVIYALENQIHHRAQVFVYLRLHGVEPPAFYER